MSALNKVKLLSFILAAMTLLSSCGEKIIEKREEATSAPESESESVEFTEEVETVEVILPVVIPDYINPLSGLGTTEELSDNRAVAVMINNIKEAMPQHGTSSADVIYECIVEGAQTRLLAVYHDIESAGVIGSVRSAREYFLDFAANHDAIFVHAGGSEEAYRQIKVSKVNNLDGVNMYVPDMFYRDSERRKIMAYEHTLMTDGQKTVDGIGFKGYRDTAKEDFEGPFDFVPFGEFFVPDGKDAKYVSVTYSKIHTPYYIYNEENSLYERYQFGEKHGDENSGEGLAFTNIIIMYAPTYYTGDEFGHYNVTVTGEGKGVYITGGQAIDITWKKPDRATPVSFYTESADELQINRGKTFVQVCTEKMAEKTVISAEIPN